MAAAPAANGTNGRDVGAGRMILLTLKDGQLLHIPPCTPHQLSARRLTPLRGVKNVLREGTARTVRLEGACATATVGIATSSKTGIPHY